MTNAPDMTAPPLPLRQEPVVRAFAWLAEHGLFTLALFALVPAVPSKGGGLLISQSQAWLATGAFLLSQCVACLMRRCGFLSALLKAAIFYTFARVLYTMLVLYGGARG